MKKIGIMFLMVVFIFSGAIAAFAQSNEKVQSPESIPPVETVSQPQQAPATTSDVMKPEAGPIEPAAEQTKPQEAPLMTPVAPVDFNTLKEILPKTLAGWQDGEVFGEKIKIENNSYSFASKEYIIGEEKSIEVQVTDYAYLESLYQPFNESRNSHYEGDQEYMKNIDFRGNPGVESYDKEAKYGEILLLVNNRFMIQVSGYNVDDTKGLFDILNTIDIDKLANLE